jgi:hypothetical protein
LIYPAECRGNLHTISKEETIMNLPDLVAAHFSRACDGALPGESVMLLSIEPEVARFVFGSTGEPEGNVVLQLGANAVVRGPFKGGFPDESRLETAIAVVEDELMKGWALPGEPRLLSLVEPTLFDVAQASGYRPQPQIELDIQAVEGLFGRLAAVSYGSPAAQQGLPMDAEFAARLLILREVLHHLRFEGVMLLA